MQGFEDPLNRGAFPWGSEDAALTDFFRTLGDLRQRESLRRGRLAYIRNQGGCLVIERAADGERTVTALNAGTRLWSWCCRGTRPRRGTA